LSAGAVRGDRAAVAVVSFNERELLAACLRSLEADAAAGRAEVWVVDNASSDGSPELVENDFPWVRLIANERNLGYGPAVNLVADRTDAGWIVASNQDVELEPGALETMIAAAAARPRVGAVAPRLVGEAGATQHSVHPFPTVGLTLLFNLGVHRLSRRLADRLCLEGYWDPDRPREVPWSIAAFLPVRREAFEAVGRFDANMWLHAEDLDLAWRLDRAGWSTWYEPSAAVRHAGSVSTRKAFGAEVEARFMAASYAWMARRRGPRVARTVAAINFAGAGLRAAALWPLARLWPGRFGVARSAYRGWTRIHARGLGPRARVVRRH
jgi:GT2 family glycosyltransferase